MDGRPCVARVSRQAYNRSSPEVVEPTDFTCDRSDGASQIRQSIEAQACFAEQARESRPGRHPTVESKPRHGAICSFPRGRRCNWEDCDESPSSMSVAGESEREEDDKCNAPCP